MRWHCTACDVLFTTDFSLPIPTCWVCLCADRVELYAHRPFWAWGYVT